MPTLMLNIRPSFVITTRCHIPLAGAVLAVVYLSLTVFSAAWLTFAVPFCLFLRQKLYFVHHGGHKPGKPGILRDFSERGKLMEFCATSGKNCKNI